MQGIALHISEYIVSESSHSFSLNQNHWPLYAEKASLWFRVYTAKV